MQLNERIRDLRQSAGMSQEKLAELLGISRQAVTKWETGQSAPSTEKLFRLAEIFGTTVDLLLKEDAEPTTDEQLRTIIREERTRRIVQYGNTARKNLLAVLTVVAAYLLIYLIGRVLWCDFSDSSFLGWLWSARPAGEGSYLYGWLLSSGLFWVAMCINILPPCLGKYRMTAVVYAGFVLGILLGMLFGPNPAGTHLGQDHYGWAIWGVVFLLSIIIGAIVERVVKRKLCNDKQAK